MREQCLGGHVARCREPRCPARRKTGAGGLVKPDIVFFGEGLPKRFFDRLGDLKKADLLLVMGTSLQVQPFASLVDRVAPDCPRVLLNLERVGEIAGLAAGGGHPSLLNETGFDFEGWTLPRAHQHEKERIRDLFMERKTDQGVQMLAEGAGWGEELSRLHREMIEKLAPDEHDERATASQSSDKAAAHLREKEEGEGEGKEGREEEAGTEGDEKLEKAREKADDVAREVADEIKGETPEDVLAKALGKLDVHGGDDRDPDKKGPSL